MNKVSDMINYLTALYGLVYVKEVIGLVVLIISLLNIVFNMILKIIAHIKNKNYEAVSQDFEDAIEQLENIKNKEEN